jgi:serine/threonine protein kinase
MSVTPPPNNETSRPIGFEVPARLLSEDFTDEALPAIEGYVLARLLVHGDRGSVYRAFKKGSHRPLALKLLSDPYLPGQLDLARAMVQSLSHIQLEHTATVLGCGEHEGRLFIVSQFVDGLPLEEYCLSPWKPPTLLDRVELLAKIAGAVAELHGRGLAHGAIGCVTVLVTVEGKPIIVDLGLEAVLNQEPPTARADVRALVGLAQLALTVSAPDRNAAISIVQPPQAVRAALQRAEQASGDGAAAAAAALASDLQRWCAAERAPRDGVWGRVRRWFGS